MQIEIPSYLIIFIVFYGIIQLIRILVIDDIKYNVKYNKSSIFRENDTYLSFLSPLENEETKYIELDEAIKDLKKEVESIKSKLV